MVRVTHYRTHPQLVAAPQAADGSGEGVVDCSEKLDEVFVENSG